MAAGDSFTAGPGVLNQQLDQLGCFRSDHNYPHLVAQALGSALRDPSCSGAVTSDLTSAQAILGGANPPQFNSLDASVATISVQIGGNDIGFTEILFRCTAVLPLGIPCRTAYTAGGVDELSRRIAATAPKVAAALATFVDVYTPSIGHDACQPPGVRWVEPLVPLSPAAPVDPNAVGMQGMATVLAAAMGG